MEKILGNENAPTSVAAIFQGTFIAAKSLGGLFLFTDPQDSTVSLATSGMLDVTPGSATPMAVKGNGTSTQFQLARLYGGVAWDVIQFASVSALKVSGTAKYSPGDFSISSTGVVTFTSAPANNATLTWIGTFQFLCRFDEDTLDATRCFTTNSGSDQWDFAAVKFTSEFV
jgi:hypothetical protein